MSGFFQLSYVLCFLECLVLNTEKKGFEFKREMAEEKRKASLFEDFPMLNVF
jgi:hypothetical protein